MFAIHPTDLKRRRARSQPVAGRLLDLPRAREVACNVCGSRRTALLATTDRYGLPARTAMCLDCGLIYMMDRLTPEGYGEFYGRGIYRQLTCAFSGKEPGVDLVQRDQYEYAARVATGIDGFLSTRGKLLDVGGSTGVIAQHVAGRFGFEATVLDPADEEVAAARKLGVEGIVGTLESYQTTARYDLILLCRSIEHLLDLSCSLRKVRDLLRPGGLFYCDIVDFVQTCRSEGAPQVVAKIDHCYWLCQQTAPHIFRALGFEIVSVNACTQPEVLGYLLKPCEPAPLEPCGASLDGVLGTLRQIDADWRRSAALPFDTADSLRRLGYRCKRTVRKLVARR